MFNKFVLIVAFVISSQSLAAETSGPLSWDTMANGQHSFRTMQNEKDGAFYKEVPMKPAPGAKLLLFNYKLAEQLGLEVPKDWAELEKIAIQNFAYVVADKPEEATKSWIATRYNPTPVVDELSASGDGRVAASGEIALPQKDGGKLYLDVMVKGIGATGLQSKRKIFGWFSHSNGQIEASKSVESMTTSAIANANMLESSADLMVLVFPDREFEVGNGTKAYKSLSVRVAPMFRPGHEDFHKKNLANLRKLIGYVAERDSGLSHQTRSEEEMNRIVKHSHALSAASLGEQAARIYDLHGVHISPTISNRTTRGTGIDMDSFRYLDANHKNYHFIDPNGEVAVEFLGHNVGDTKNTMLKYLQVEFDYAKMAGFFHTEAEFAELKANFDRAYDKTLAELWLNRIGLDTNDIKKLSRTTLNELVESMKVLYDRQGLREISVGEKSFLPAAYYVRGIFHETPNIIYNQGNSLEAWMNVFVHDRPWATMDAQNQTLIADAKRFQAAAGRAFYELGAVTPNVIQRRISKAASINANDRTKTTLRWNNATGGFNKTQISAVYKAFLNSLNGQGDWHKAQELFEGIVSSTTDVGVQEPTRPYTRPRVSPTQVPQIVRCEAVF